MPSRAREPKDRSAKIYGKVKGPYRQSSIRARIEALLLDNLGKILTREQILQVAKDPKSGKEPENWHQRLSELRTDEGYTILSWRNRGDLDVEEYLMPHAEKRPKAARRIRPTDATWLTILKRADCRCEWNEGGKACGLRDGETDPVGGGTVHLTPDHKTPHSTDAHVDPTDPDKWQALCGRHQVVKKNNWDNTTGKLNVSAIVQAAGRKEKEEVFLFLLTHFGYTLRTDGTVDKMPK
jgi:hypothetical protein